MNYLKSILMAVACCLSMAHATAQAGRVDCSQSIQSEILKKEMHYSVYLPPSYERSNRPYPVLYLLHGMWDNYQAWATKGEVEHIATQMMQSGEVPECIIIMPDGLIDAFYLNNYDESVRWDDFFHQEFIPHIEQQYRVIKQPNKRGIAGLSMGGYGALYHMMKHQNFFGACYAMSAAVIEVDPSAPKDEFNTRFQLKLWGPDGQDGFPENYKKHSVQEMVMAMDDYQAKGRTPWGPTGPFPKTCIDCGDDDFLIKENMNLVKIMKDKKLPFEFRVRDGGHDWEYWRSGLRLALVFVGDVFRERQ